VLELRNVGRAHAGGGAVEIVGPDGQPTEAASEGASEARPEGATAHDDAETTADRGDIVSTPDR
jgi:hypothetical protein